MLCTFLRVDDPADPGTPQAYRDHRRQDAEPVAAQIRAQGGRAIAIEADLSDPGIPAILFDTAEAQLGPVNILVNNATGWVADTFAPSGADRLGRSLRPVSAATWQQQFTVDAMASELPSANQARTRTSSRPRPCAAPESAGRREGRSGQPGVSDRQPGDAASAPPAAPSAPIPPACQPAGPWRGCVRW